jgi:hypothetical protein
MTRDRVHFLEFGHVNITESTDFSLWLRNLTASNSISGSFSRLASLFFAFSCKLGFDSKGLFAQFIHHTLSFGTQLGARMSESELEGWRGYLRRCLLLDSRRLIRARRLKVDETMTQTRVRLLGCAMMGLTGVHLFHRWLDASCCGRSSRGERRGDYGVKS